MTDFSETRPTFGHVGKKTSDSEKTPTSSDSRPKYSESPSLDPSYMSEWLWYVVVCLTEPLVIDGQCPLSICLTWMSHRLHNSQRKRLGTKFYATESLYSSLNRISWALKYRFLKNYFLFTKNGLILMRKVTCQVRWYLFFKFQVNGYDVKI